MLRRVASLLLLLVLVCPLGRAGADEPSVHIGRDFGLEKGWRRVANGIRAELDRVPPGQKVIYLSGPISTGGKGSIAANLAEGNRVVAELRAAGYYVISPFEMEQNLRVGRVDRWKLHASFMRMWARVLEHPRIDEMVLLPGAETSVGATQEVGLFVAKERPISSYRPRPGGGFRLTPMRYDPVLSRVEHTLLKPGVTEASIRDEARWAGSNRLRAMVVRPEFVYAVAEEVRGSLTVPAAVIGFPQKAFTSLADFPNVETDAKVADARNAIDGAQAAGARVLELDMIMDVHAFKAGDYARVAEDIRTVIAAAKAYGAPRGVHTKVKVIVETSLLEAREVAIASAIVRHTSALAVKTSTGFGPRGARLRDVKTMARVMGGAKLIKVSAGVTAENLGQFVKHGHIFGMSRSRELKGGPAPRPAAPAPRTGRSGGY